VDEPLMWIEGQSMSAGQRWLMADRQGSVVAAADASGAPIGEPYRYGPYGEPDSANGFSGSRFRYTGQIALPEAQLYHYKARVYDPVLGRFLQTDPVGYEQGPNLYAYVHNDPLNGRDPMGLAVEPNTCSRVGGSSCSGDYQTSGGAAGGGVSASAPGRAIAAIQARQAPVLHEVRNTPGQVTVESRDASRVGEYRTSWRRDFHIFDGHVLAPAPGEGSIASELMRNPSLRAQTRALTIQNGTQEFQFNGRIHYRWTLPWVTGTTGAYRVPGAPGNLPSEPRYNNTNEWVVVVEPTGLTNARGEPIYNVITEFPPRPLGTLRVIE
jgi:RHS repeat-associated protein